MRASFARRVLALGLGCFPLQAVAAAQDLCPDVRASQVDARETVSGDSPRCGIGIRIFGLGGGLFGPRCPETTFTYPSHQECLGESAPGNLCLAGDSMTVLRRRCECSELTLLGTGFLSPVCDCNEDNQGGEVQDASTQNCRPILDPPDHPLGPRNYP